MVSTTMIRRWLSVGGPEPVDGLGDDVDGGVEAEGEVGDHGRSLSIVLGMPTTGSPKSLWRRRATPRVSSPPMATRASSPRARKFVRSGGQVGLGVLVRVGPRRAEDRPALADDAVGLRRRRAGELIFWIRPAPAFEDADARPPFVRDPLDDGADDRVQAGAVAAAGQQADFHERSVQSAMSGGLVDRGSRCRPIPGRDAERDDPPCDRLSVSRGGRAGQSRRERSIWPSPDGSSGGVASAAGLGHEDALDPGGVDAAVDEVGVAEDPAVERDRRLDALDRPARRGRGASWRGPRGGSGRGRSACRRASRSWGGRYSPTWTCESQRTPGPPGTRSAVIRPGEGRKSLSGSSELIRHSKRMAAGGDLVLAEREGLAGGDPDLLLDEVDAGDHLGDGVLDLDPGVDLDEVEVVVGVDEELAGARR